MQQKIPEGNSNYNILTMSLSVLCRENKLIFDKC